MSNTLIQHEEVPERTNMWYIFEMRIVQRYQKIYFHVLNAQIQNKVPEGLNNVESTCGIFLKR